jgi:hypothetical protein
MELGDLVRLDIPKQSAHGKIGMVIGKVPMPTYGWMKDVQTFSYEVMVGTEVWRVGYCELIEEESWSPDEAG